MNDTWNKTYKSIDLNNVHLKQEYIFFINGNTKNLRGIICKIKNNLKIVYVRHNFAYGRKLDLNVDAKYVAKNI
jgi:glycerol-3-phosphate responsive antiterminator